MEKVRYRTGFSIRTKLLLVGVLLLLIPWMSYVYVRDMKSFLLAGQENALTLTARAVSTVLHDRPELFLSTDDNLLDAGPTDIYAYPLPNYVRLDGDTLDWGETVNQSVGYTLNASGEVAESLTVRQVLGYRGPYLYVLFDVQDDKVIMRHRDWLRLDSADHIRLTLQGPTQDIKRYLLTTRQSGRMSVYLMDEEWRYPLTGKPNYDLAAEMEITETGYLVELRIPRFMVGSDTRIQLAVADVDDETQRMVKDVVSSNPQTEAEALSRVVVHSPEIAKILQALDRPDTRIWVLDRQKSVRTVVGNLITEEEEAAITDNSPLATIQRWYDLALGAIFNLIVDEQGVTADEDVGNDQILDDALLGIPNTLRRAAEDNNSVILISANPVYSGDEVLGAVVVEQSSNVVLSLQQEVLERVISVTLLVLLTVISALLFFASRLTLRIRRLRDATDSAIDRDGRIIEQSIGAEAFAGDEIGDLSRSVSGMLGRLAQYTHYLERLPDTLAHEVSNPLNVVDSSLDNLVEEIPESRNSKYMERAKSGLHRIGSILKNLTAAANLEQAMQADSRELFDFAQLIEDYVDGCRHTHPEQEFELEVAGRPMLIDGTPDHLAQMLDKLIDNALDFVDPGSPIRISIKKSGASATLEVSNRGAPLPEGMSERIFDPLVSMGRKDANKPRLGMGLYIVKLIVRFHGGTVSARDYPYGGGAIMEVTLPLTEGTGTSRTAGFGIGRVAEIKG